MFRTGHFIRNDRSDFEEREMLHPIMDETSNFLFIYWIYIYVFF